MTSTATALTNAGVAPAPNHQVSTKVSAAIADDYRHEHTGNLISQALDRRFEPCARPSLTMPARSVAPPTPVARMQGAPSIERAGEDRSARRLGLWLAFAREYGSSTVEAPSRTMPSTGTLSPARTMKLIAGHDVGDRDLDERPAALHVCDLRRQPQQPLERRRCSRLGAGLEQFAQQHQRDDRGAGLEIHMLLVPAEHRDHRTEAPCHRRAQHDEHVHVGAASAQRVPRAEVKAAADPELHRRREHELQPARKQIRMRSAAKPVALREHRRHLRQQWQRQYGCDDDFALERPVRGGPAHLVLGALAFGVAANKCVVAGALDCGDELVGAGDRRIEASGRGLGREVDGCFDSRDPVQRLFDARRTRGTGHAPEAELEPFPCAEFAGWERGSRIHERMIYPRRVFVNIPV
jgi:hypothetical protein